MEGTLIGNFRKYEGLHKCTPMLQVAHLWTMGRNYLTSPNINRSSQALWLESADWGEIILAFPTPSCPLLTLAFSLYGVVIINCNISETHCRLSERLFWATDCHKSLQINLGQSALLCNYVTASAWAIQGTNQPELSWFSLRFSCSPCTTLVAKYKISATLSE